MKLIDANGRLVVRGEVGDQGQEGSIELRSFEVEADRDNSLGRGSSRGPGGRAGSHFASCSKATDSATPLLLQMLLTGRPAPINAEITINRAGNVLFPASTVKITLQNVGIAKFIPGGGGITDGVAIDNFGLAFEKSGFAQVSRNDQTATVRSRLRALNAPA